MFSIQTIEDPEIKQMYDQSMKDLCGFFELGWDKNVPKLFLIKDEKTINELWNNNANDCVAGWVDNLDIYIVDKNTFKKKDGQEYSNDEYRRLIKHELTHSFTKVVTEIYTRLVLPDWLWEGIAMYLAGDIEDKEQSKKLTSFLNHYKQDMKSMEVYDEAGFAVKFLVEKHGKGKLLELLRVLKDISSEDGFNRRFEKIYSFELKHENFL